MQCNNDQSNYIYNRNITLLNYRDPFSLLLCIHFDNSDVWGRFYETLDKKTVNDYDLLLQQFRLDHLSYYPDYYLKSYALPNSAQYEYGQGLRVKASTTAIKYYKFLLPKAGPFGQCAKNNAVNFMINIDNSQCALRLVYY
jgi:hypothetical protein